MSPSLPPSSVSINETASTQLPSRHRMSEEADDHAVAEFTSESYSRACIYLITQLCHWREFFLVYVVSLISLMVSIGFWTGSYNLLLSLFMWVTMDHAWLAYALSLLVGWALMWATRGNALRTSRSQRTRSARHKPGDSRRDNSSSSRGRDCSGGG